MILKLTKIKLNPFSANPSKDISLSSAVKFWEMLFLHFKIWLQKNFDSILERCIFPFQKWKLGEGWGDEFKNFLCYFTLEVCCI